MTKAEKEALNAVMQEMSDGIAKSKVKVINNVDQKSVQLLAKELAVYQATFASAPAPANPAPITGDTSKQIQDLYAAMRKLSADLFAELKLL